MYVYKYTYIYMCVHIKMYISLVCQQGLQIKQNLKLLHVLLCYRSLDALLRLQEVKVSMSFGKITEPPSCKAY